MPVYCQKEHLCEKQASVLWSISFVQRISFFFCLPLCFNAYKACSNTLRKQVYSKILKISPPKTENFQLVILIFFHISAQDIDCGYSLEPPRRGGSNEYPQSIFWSKNKKNNVYHVNPSFTL